MGKLSRWLSLVASCSVTFDIVHQSWVANHLHSVRFGGLLLILCCDDLRYCGTVYQMTGCIFIFYLLFFLPVMLQVPLYLLLSCVSVWFFSFNKLYSVISSILSGVALGIFLDMISCCIHSLVFIL